MNRAALPSSKKTHSEKHKQILKQLLKEPANKTCADCKTSSHPRWALWSLGCFVCIRCSGIHRSMGTHILKVKSVDLDAWTDEQVESMVKWGNHKTNGYWEAKLPEGYVPDQLKIENFIRTKYEMKKWVLSPTVPNPMALKSAEKPAPDAAKTSSSHSADLLDDDFGSFTTSPSPVPVPAIKNSQKLPIQASSNPLPRLPTQVSGGSHNGGLQSSQSTGGSFNNGRNDLKKSILSLYSSPSSSSSSFIQPQQRQQQAVNNLSNSLGGLNFGSPAVSQSTNSVAPSARPPVPTKSPQIPSQQWANEWTTNSSSSSLPAKPTGSVSIGLDDDLFKNVWN